MNAKLLHRQSPGQTNSMTWFAGGVSGASHVGCPSSGQSGFCEITHREWSKHAPFSHHLQTRGVVQYGRTKLRHFLFPLCFLFYLLLFPYMPVNLLAALQMHGSLFTNVPLHLCRQERVSHQVPLVLTAQLSVSKAESYVITKR